MKYGFDTLPSTHHGKKFRVRSNPPKSEAYFNISYEVCRLWGNPTDNKLQQFMIAHIKKNGWSKSPVEITDTKTAKDLSNYVAALSGNPKKKPAKD